MPHTEPLADRPPKPGPMVVDTPPPPTCELRSPATADHLKDAGFEDGLNGWETEASRGTKAPHAWTRNATGRFPGVRCHAIRS
jgi:hypothetical protein